MDEKSNEITAIPQLLDMLEVAGCIVTIDAMGWQTDIAAKIIEKEADYVLAVKGNEGNLYADLVGYFDWALEDKFKHSDYTSHQTTDGDHGRIEVRRYSNKGEVKTFVLLRPALFDQGHRALADPISLATVPELCL